MKQKNYTYNEILVKEVALLHLTSVDKELVQRNSELFLLLLGAVGIVVCSVAIRLASKFYFDRA